MDNTKIDKLVEETINSMDGAGKAMPAPFLLTRIHARMNREQSNANYWERVVAFLTRPAIAFPAIALVLFLNFWIMRSSSSNNDKSDFENQMVVNDGYSINNATSLFDLENTP